MKRIKDQGAKVRIESGSVEGGEYDDASREKRPKAKAGTVGKVWPWNQLEYAHLQLYSRLSTQDLCSTHQPYPVHQL